MVSKDKYQQFIGIISVETNLSKSIFTKHQIMRDGKLKKNLCFDIWPGLNQEVKSFQISRFGDSLK